MKKLFVGNLAPEATEESVKEVFSEFGTVRSIKLVTDLFSGQCKGFGFIEMEGHEARSAIEGLDGKVLGTKPMKVNFEDTKRRGGKRGRR